MPSFIEVVTAVLEVQVATVAEHIAATDSAICANIAGLTSQRDLLSQNVLGQLRNLVEGVAVRLHTGRGDGEYDYTAIETALSWVKANGRLNFVTKFHTLLQLVQNVATVGDFAVWYADSALEIRDAWAATVRVARARRELGLAFGEDFDCLHDTTRGCHVPTSYRTVSWGRVPGSVLSYPPGESLPDDLVDKIDEIDSLIATPPTTSTTCCGTSD